MKEAFLKFLKELDWQKIIKKLYDDAIYPKLKEYVESTEQRKWDDALLDAIDLIVDRFLSEEKVEEVKKIEE